MSRRSKTVLAVLAVIVVASGLAVALFDWNLLRGFVERKVTERSGRQFSIGGNLNVHLGLTPRIQMEKIKLANAAWATEPKMLDIDALEFTVSLKDLLHGDIVLPEVALSHPTVALEKSPDGKRNWILKLEQKPSDQPPAIGRLSVDNGILLYRDPAIDTNLKVALSTDSATADAAHALKFNAQGRFKGMPSTAVGEGGSVLSLRDAATPYPIKATIGIGDTHAKIDGAITGLASLAGIDLALDLSGSDLEQLYNIVGLATPNTPPYHVAGRLLHSGKIWQLNKFSGKVGDSDLAGDIRVDRSGAKPKLTSELTSRVLDIDDLAGTIGAPPKTGPGETASPRQRAEAARLKRRSRALPDKEFAFARLNKMDADVTLKAQSIRRKKLPLDNLALHVQLVDGILKASPLNFGVADGNVITDITIDGRGEHIGGRAAIKFSKLQLSKLIPSGNLTKSSFGSLSGHADLAGQGNSFAKLLGSADGELSAVIAGGKISNLLLEFAGIDGGEIIKFLLAGDRRSTLRCAVTDFKITNGIMKSRVFVFDTDDTNITGSGTVSLKNETLDLTLVPLPKDMSILSVRSPLHVTGTFKKPSFTPDKSALAMRGGAALTLGALIGPLAALIPLIETGPGKDSDCKALIAAVTETKPRKK